MMNTRLRAKYEQLRKQMPMEMEPIEGDASAREIFLKWNMPKQLLSTSKGICDGRADIFGG
jgi:hypothetical protein